MIMVRNVTPDDWALLRDIRLRALRDSPDAFGTTYVEAVGYDDQVWRTRASGGSMFFACLDGRPDQPVGLAGGYLEQPGEVHLISMWVAPEARGQAAGEALVEAVASWAFATHHADCLHLWVTEANKPAVRLYERIGFRATGARQPLPSNPALSEIAMSRPIVASLETQP
ncbi:MAG TPA: GNAT family N-acetyltransferase [Streptosporangiaceae bacterium]|nr:GNAT family N-acetyltransferase [Streptosporangiaceae bacterium]